MNKNLMLVLILVLGCFALLPAVAEAQTDIDIEFQIDWVGVAAFDCNVLVDIYDAGGFVTTIQLNPNAGFDVWIENYSDPVITVTQMVFRWDEGAYTWDIVPPFNEGIAPNQPFVLIQAEANP